jgi:hypothetical protein
MWTKPKHFNLYPPRETNYAEYNNSELTMYMLLQQSECSCNNMFYESDTAIVLNISFLDLNNF